MAKAPPTWTTVFRVEARARGHRHTRPTVSRAAFAASSVNGTRHHVGRPGGGNETGLRTVRHLDPLQQRGDKLRGRGCHLGPEPSRDLVTHTHAGAVMLDRAVMGTRKVADRGDHLAGVE
jgi:hypothetical protein